IGLPIEAPLAIGNNGWIYGATRSVNSVAHAFAINPVTATIVWQIDVPFNNDAAVGVVVSPVIDQEGFVYVARYGHGLAKLDPGTGDTKLIWNTDGKLCQAPTLLQNGLLLVGQSFFPDISHSELTAFKTDVQSAAPPVWTSTGTAG